MTSPRRFVLLVGSPKGNGGTSLQLGRYLMDRLPGDGTEKVVHHLGKALRKDASWAQVLADVDSADTVILTFPLYWDALPSHATRALEMLAEHRGGSPPGKSPHLVVMVNNGFPEPWHNEVALRICRRFAHEAGLGWGGALNVAGGAAIVERPVEETGGMTRRLREALDEAARTIGTGEPLSRDQEEAVARQMYPSWIPTVLGGVSWRRLARVEGMKGSMRDRPYE